MSTHAMRKTSWRAVASSTLLVLLAGCSQGVDGSGPTDPRPADGGSANARPDDGTTDIDPGASPGPQTDEVSYDDDAGADLDVYEYPDDPPPAEENVATLCNLNQEYFTSLRGESGDGEPVVDENLRLSVLSMSDNLRLWEGMRSHFPDLAGAIDTARHVHSHWDVALLNEENGDTGAAAEAMLQAEEAIEELPNVDAVGELECPS